MPILAKRFPEYGVVLQVFRDVITREAWMAYYAGFTAAETDRFLSYLDPSADFSNIDLASGSELKRVVAAKLREVFGDRPVISILVPGSEMQAPYAKFWCRFERIGERHPAKSVVVPDLEAAFDQLGLANDARETLAAAAKS